MTIVNGDSSDSSSSAELVTMLTASNKQSGTRQIASAFQADDLVGDLLLWMRRAISPIYRNKAKTHTLRTRLQLPAVPSPSRYSFKRGRAEDDGFHVMMRYLDRLTFRVFNDRHKAGLPVADRVALRAALEIYVERHMSKFLWVPSSPDDRLRGYAKWALVDEAGLNRLAELVSRNQLEAWTPDWIEEQTRRGAAGGQGSKRPNRWANPSNLDALEALQGLSKPEQAKRLGISESSIDRGRKALKARTEDRAETEQEGQMEYRVDEFTERAEAQTWELRWARLIADQRREERALVPLLDGLVL